MRVALLGTLLLLGTSELAAQGTVYRPSMSVLNYNLAGKAAVSAALYAGLRELGMSKPGSGVVAVLVPLAVGKLVALTQHHRVPPLDVLHDLAWHSLFVLPLATRKPGALGISVGIILLTCHQASPRC